VSIQRTVIGGAELYRSCAREWLPTVASETADFAFFDPPYACIKREYGYWTEETWFDLMRFVMPHVMRILKPLGSAVVVLQPNSESNGRMRLWLWEFALWVGKEWGLVQDVYWWNPAAIPACGAREENGLMRASVKHCIWIGNPQCYRAQGEILLTETDSARVARHAGRKFRKHPSGYSTGEGGWGCAEIRGGVTPFNLWPIPNTSNKTHGASTPVVLTDAWIRYACPPGGTVIDPFFGSGTTPRVCIKTNRRFMGCEVMAKYYDQTVNELR
jgi:DNA modification methylase